MTPPSTRKVIVGHLTFPISLQSEDEEDYGETYGTFSHREGIELDGDQLPAEMADTLLHEMLHAVWHVYRLPAKCSEETVCTRLAGPLLSLMRDNPVLFKDLLAAVTDGVPLLGED